MDKEAVLRIIRDFGKALEAERVSPRKIILFGSYSTGTQREGSDIDLVVISEDFADKDYWERIDILSSAIRAHRGGRHDPPGMGKRRVSDSRLRPQRGSRLRLRSSDWIHPQVLQP